MTFCFNISTKKLPFNFIYSLLLNKIKTNNDGNNIQSGMPLISSVRYLQIERLSMWKSSAYCKKNICRLFLHIFSLSLSLSLSLSYTHTHTHTHTHTLTPKVFLSLAAFVFLPLSFTPSLSAYFPSLCLSFPFNFFFFFLLYLFFSPNQLFLLVIFDFYIFYF